MYRYGDGTPFPLDENFIETITAAVEACTSAFMPLTELDGRRERARATRAEADHELARLAELDKTVATALSPYLVADKRGVNAQAVAQKVLAATKAAGQAARAQLEGRVAALEAQAAAATAADAVRAALRPFFDNHQLPATKWVTTWDTRGAEARAEATATAGKLTATFQLVAEPRQPIRVDQLADGVIIHMMKKGLLGKAKPAPIDLGKHVMVAFEKTPSETVVTLKERPDKPCVGIRFAVTAEGATWQSISVTGEPEADPSVLDPEDLAGVRRLADGAGAAFKELTARRTLTEVALGSQKLAALPEPRVAPMEVLAQLSPLARTIRQRSRMSGELVLKRDLSGGRREELFVPRAQLAHAFGKLPPEYRAPFEDMGITGEDTQPSMPIPRPPASTQPPPVGTTGPNMPTMVVKK